MSEVSPQEQPLKEESEPTIEEIEEQFTELFNQMSAAAKKLSLLGKRIREETAPLPDIGALEQEYLSLHVSGGNIVASPEGRRSTAPLPVSTRPSWFEYVASRSESLTEAKKFAPQQASNQ